MTTERLGELYEKTGHSIYKNWDAYKRHREVSREWARNNREKHNGYMREWYNKDPERARAIQKRSAQKKSVEAKQSFFQEYKRKYEY